MQRKGTDSRLLLLGLGSRVRFYLDILQEEMTCRWCALNGPGKDLSVNIGHNLFPVPAPCVLEPFWNLKK